MTMMGRSAHGRHRRHWHGWQTAQLGLLDEQSMSSLRLVRSMFYFIKEPD
jgi:hypothetical protein